MYLYRLGELTLYSLTDISLSVFLLAESTVRNTSLFLYCISSGAIRCFRGIFRRSYGATDANLHTYRVLPGRYSHIADPNSELLC